MRLHGVFLNNAYSEWMNRDFSNAIGMICNIIWLPPLIFYNMKQQSIVIFIKNAREWNIPSRDAHCGGLLTTHMWQILAVIEMVLNFPFRYDINRFILSNKATFPWNKSCTACCTLTKCNESTIRYMESMSSCSHLLVFIIISWKEKYLRLQFLCWPVV